ncbi:RNA polymerase sigma factor [Pedobacter ginsengisoli]|uniref:RNA polymerase sigma factor n=1 Tax=Pedobacter ginsengisoli TaxID=363852 RepID=UPI0025502CA5|nr:sigma-70 family RNA polymerase sigma factor [Pedobacter ginsengisoli]
MDVYLTYSDQELTSLLRRGDGRAYRVLYSKYWEQTYNNVYKRLRNHDQSEDITQDIFLQLWLKREEVAIVNLGAYLYIAARNSVFRSMEKQAQFIPIADLLNDFESVHDHADSKILTVEFMRAYEALVNALPEGQQTIFRMRFNEDLSPDEIAIKLGLSPKTVRNQLGKAISTLRTSMTMLVAILTFLQK